VAAYLVGAKFDGLTNSYMTPEQRADLDLDSREHYNRVWGSKIQVIGWSFYAAILWGLKVCITAVYGRLTYVNHEFVEDSYLAPSALFANLPCAETESTTWKSAYEWDTAYFLSPTWVSLSQSSVLANLSTTSGK
jgi:hypothetical protein